MIGPFGDERGDLVLTSRLLEKLECKRQQLDVDSIKLTKSIDCAANVAEEWRARSVITDHIECANANGFPQFNIT